jgi:penicillin-binding protein 1C
VGVDLAFPEQATIPGLPIALGGVGIDLQGLVTLFAALADQGKAAPLDFAATPGAAMDYPSLVDPVSAYYLTGILLDTPPPPSFLAAANRRSAQPIAYKTGTSFGFRDAWAIGYTHDFTIGIWVGRPDGTFSAGRMGRDAAAPILFEAFDLLPVGPSALAAKAPLGAILAGNLDLPANLQHFRSRFGALAGTGGMRAAIKVAFPVDGALLELAPEQQEPEHEAAGDPLPSLILKADGGVLPLRWLVNGRPIESLPYRRQAEWAPDGRGAVRVTVIDRDGRSATSAIWIK